MQSEKRSFESESLSIFSNNWAPLIERYDSVLCECITRRMDGSKQAKLKSGALGNVAPVTAARLAGLTAFGHFFAQEQL
jgi:hypothetical protein